MFCFQNWVIKSFFVFFFNFTELRVPLSKQVKIMNFLNFHTFYYCTQIFISLLAFFCLLFLSDCSVSCSHSEGKGVIVNIQVSGANTERQFGSWCLRVEHSNPSVSWRFLGCSKPPPTPYPTPQPQQEQLFVFYSIQINLKPI